MQVEPVNLSRGPDATLRDVLSVIGRDGKVDPKVEHGLDPESITDLYRAMVRTRIVDERLVALQRQGRIGFHIGSLGEEAAILGATAALREQDWLFPCYREFGALLYRGMPLQDYLNNMYGNDRDPVRGRQMPDHYTGRAYRFGSVSSPIGTQITQAAGFAWAAKLRKQDEVVAVFFGEGATSSAEFHTGMNFAGVYKAPVVFLCRNNGWAISVPSEKQTASDGFASKGVAYGIPGVRCDGNDLLAVHKAVRSAVERAAAGEGPTIIELHTYRLGGHSTSDDPKAYRAEDEVTEWRKVDPILRLRAYLDQAGLWTDAQEDAWRTEVESEFKACVAEAEAVDPPPLATMFEDVYGSMPQHLREQAEACAAGPRAKSAH